MTTTSERITTAPPDLVVNPAFRTSRSGGRAELHNPHEGIRLQATGPVARIWENGTVPPDLSDQDGLIRQLTALRFLVPAGTAELARRGVARRSAYPLGAASWDGTAATWVVVGCAADFNANHGARPAGGMPVVRRALTSRLGRGAPTDAHSWALRRRVATDELGVADYGDLVYEDGTDTALRLHERVGFAVGQVLDSGRRPLLIGGDHSLSYPAITEVARRHPGLRVVHLDAHADRHRSFERGTTAHCGDFVSWVRRSAPQAELMTIGVRGFDTNFDDRSPDPAVAYATADEVREDGFLERLRRFCADRPTYLTLDIDVLDPAFAPEVAYPSVGGLTHHETSDIVSTVARAARLVGADFVEVCESQTTSNAAAARQADFILTMLLNQA